MDISVSSNAITISGNIKSVSNYQDIKSAIDSVIADHNAITINITESISITSSIIGYFNKLVLKDKINLNMTIGNEQLMELIDDLNLKTLFKARKV